MSLSKNQPDLFGSTVGSTSLTGLEVVLPRACRCGATLATIGSSAGPHHASLKCGCGAHRGWVSYETHQFLTGIIDTFGRPDQPVTVRFKDSRISANNPAAAAASASETAK